MTKVIIVRYAEIHLKGRNRNFFENLLVENLRFALKEYNVLIKKISGRYLISNVKEQDIDDISNALMCVAGVFSFSVANEVDTSIENLTETATSLAKEIAGTFKIVTNRADKKFEMNSMEVSKFIGGKCLEANNKLKVDVTNPQNTISIDIRENGKTYIFTHNTFAMGGMPVGSAGNGLLLLSGGIDSPVAGYMMAKRGVKVFALHFHSFPYTSPQAKEKVLSLAKILTKYTGQMTVHMVSVTKIQQAIHENCKSDYMITILRRFMFKIAEIIAKKYGYQMLITGESLGQVASQTIESMSVVQNVINDIVVTQPLVAFDKIDTINISKKIGTYETSIKPFEDCCTVFLPENPVTKPRLEKVLEQEQKLDLDNLLTEAISDIETIIIG